MMVSLKMQFLDQITNTVHAKPYCTKIYQMQNKTIYASGLIAQNTNFG